MKKTLKFFTNPSIVGISIYVILISLVIKVAGFYKETVLAKVFGVAVEVDNFYLGFLIINVISTIITGALVAAFMPNFVGRLYDKDKDQNSVIDMTYLVAIIVSVLVITILYSSFALLEPSDLLFSYVKVFLPVIFFSTITFVSNAILNAVGKFLVPSMCTIFIPILPLYPLLFVPEPSLMLVAEYLTAGYIVNSILVLTYSIWTTRYLPFFHLKADAIRKDLRTTQFFRNFVLLIGAYLFLPGVEIISQVIVSFFFEGGVSQINYANKVTSGIVSILAFSFATVLFPEYSRLFARSDLKRFYNTIFHHTYLFLITLLAAAGFLCLFSADIVQFAFLGGRFLPEDSTVVSNLQVIFFSSDSILYFEHFERPYSQQYEPQLYLICSQFLDSCCPWNFSIFACI